MVFSTLDETLFRNVDLDIYSQSDLQPLVTALGDHVIDLYVGRVRRTYEAHLELNYRRGQTANSVILGFCKLINRLPPMERTLWNRAKIRSFDIGIDVPKRDRHFWIAVSPEAVQAAAETGAQIAITVYGPLRSAPKPKKRA